MEADFNSILGSISSDVLTATAGALALSLLSPLRARFDRQQRRNEAQWKLEALKSMVEIETALRTASPQRIEAFRRQFEEVVSGHRDLQRLYDPTATLSQANIRAPFNHVDILAAAFVPVVTGLLLLSDVVVDEQFEVMMFMGFSTVISLAFARLIVWPLVRGGFAQTLLQIFCSILALVPGLALTMAAIGEL